MATHSPVAGAGLNQLQRTVEAPALSHVIYAAGAMHSAFMCATALAVFWLDDMMNFSGLTLFVRVARLGSISAAARDLGVTPAAASARLASFEKELGARLVHRTTRLETLTEDVSEPHLRLEIGFGRAVLPSFGCRPGDVR
ncbi:helix-turn-helix domain-containing protein [Lysobacter sp. D1-1-M9]|uniref:helix-turn-helix domain-containing protein n=1 Tax=Novilysobacter longmucuonensis TaxID=3098603 RepID=UPI002FC983EC